MKRIALLFCLAALFASARAQANNVEFTNMSDMLDAQQREIDDLRARLSSLEISQEMAGMTYGAVVGGEPGLSPPSTCMDCCECPMEQWTAGVGLAFLKPHFRSNPAYFVDGGLNTQQVSFDWDHEAVPLFWIHYQNERRFGGRLRYMEFDQSSRLAPTDLVGATLIIPGSYIADQVDATDVSATSGLDYDLWELEMTQGIDLGVMQVLGGAGLRYVHLQQGYHLQGTGADVFSQSTSRSFNGFGPSLSLEVTHEGQTGLTAFGIGRTALLFGNQSQIASTDGPDAGGDFESVLRTGDWGVLPVGELEVGVRGQNELGGMAVFAEFAVVGQLWLGAGNAAGAEFRAVDNDQDLGFFGTRISGGVQF